MLKRGIFIRNFEGGRHLQSFLVSAVAAVLAIRLYLELADYPKLGGSRLHIAHMLWGGLLMLAALVLLLSFLGRGVERLAAIIGGVGFGTFIDEVGKFVTSDNDYFFRPAVAMIYLIFILLFLGMRSLQTRQVTSESDYLINALREMEELAQHDLDTGEHRRALDLLRQSDPKHPLVAALKAALLQAEIKPTARRGRYARLKRRVRFLYHRLSHRRWFSLAVTGFFITQLVVKLAYVFILIFILGLGWDQILDVRVIGRVAARAQHLTFIDWAQIAASAVSALFVLIGILRIRRSRLFAFRMFERSIAVSIFLTQVFAFYKEQFSALFGLGLNILILVTLRFMIAREQAEIRNAAPEVSL